MSGWIPFDKDMVDDPRVYAMAEALNARLEVQASAEQPDNSPYAEGEKILGNRVTDLLRNVVTGALVRLWKYADDHIRDDDTLPGVCSYAVDAIVGVEGFVAIVPPEWLVELDDGSIRLPNYCAKTGLITKRKRAAESKARVQALRARRRGSASGSASGNRVGSSHETLIVAELPAADNSATILRETETDTETSETKKGAPPALVLHDSLPRAEWAEWIEVRRKRRWPLDRVTLGKQLKLLAQYSTDAQRSMIENSIQAGWQGIFPPKGNGHDATVGAVEGAQAAYRRLVASGGSERDERVQAALDAIGGWQRVRMRTPASEAQVEREFCRAWEGSA